MMSRKNATTSRTARRQNAHRASRYLRLEGLERRAMMNADGMPGLPVLEFEDVLGPQEAYVDVSSELNEVNFSQPVPVTEIDVDAMADTIVHGLVVEAKTEELKERLAAGDDTAIPEMLELANFVDNTPVYDINIEAQDDAWLLETFGEALEQFKETKVNDIKTRLAEGDESAIADMLELADFFDTNEGYDVDVEAQDDAWLMETFGESLEEFKEAQINEIKERLRNGDTTAIEDMIELGELFAGYGNCDLEGDDPVDAFIQEHFAGALRLFNTMVEFDLRQRLRAGDETAVAEAIDHLAFKGIGGAGDDAQTILESREFGDAAEQFQRETGSQIADHVPAPQPVPNTDPRAGDGPVDYR